MTPARRRPLDKVLVERGHVADVAAARALVAAGRVLVDGAPAWSPARAVAAGEQVTLVEVAQFVGRGGRKLDAAIRRFAVDVLGRRALDVGASTGGFTECLLQHGAARVLAVDVGRAQLHERLLADARVVSMERTNVRDLDRDDVVAALGDLPDVITVDLSFTSLVPHTARIVALGAPISTLLVLVKPQFEVDRVTASKGRGVVTEPMAWRSSLASCASALEEAGAGIMGAMASPVLGASGNVEFFLHASLGRPQGHPPSTPLLEAAVGEAVAR
ncbi:MAG TPA: TlyA family RNA methyltransferase [Acidimicrobiales bacterium]|nr:TlyA family RNA methyltransferase [Acidimicrobiales bacterium]